MSSKAMMQLAYEADEAIARLDEAATRIERLEVEVDAGAVIAKRLAEALGEIARREGIPEDIARAALRDYDKAKR